MQKKYIVIGGYVNSESDGELHFVRARDLCQLYHVNPDECYLLYERRPFTLPEYDLRGLPDLPQLRPQFHGADYKHPDE